MISVRQFRRKDIDAINKIYEQEASHGLPGLENVVGNITIVEDNTVVGYGVINKFIEATLLLNRQCSKKNLSICLRLAMDSAINTCKQNKVERLYITTSVPGFDRIMQKHYGFKECKDPYFMLEI